MSYPKALLTGCILACSLAAVRANVRLPSIFSDRMVVQAGKPVAVWGWADSGEKVTVTLAGSSASAVADRDGKWSLKLPPLKAASEGQTMAVKGANALEIGDVLIGEVWLCSGQSNMEMQLKGLHGQVVNADAEIAAANYPKMRMFVFDEVYDIYKLAVPPSEPQAERKGSWIVCSPETAAHFTAVGYFFGRELYRHLGVPIGLVHSSVGGTPVEAWTSREAQEAHPEIKPVLDDWAKRTAGYDAKAAYAASVEAKNRWDQGKREAAKPGRPPKAPARFKNLEVMAPFGLFNGMIAPLIPYTLRGVIWYQGERNSAGPLSKYYGRQLEIMIADWRARWSDDFYFAWVQLPSFLKKQTAPVELNGWGVQVRDGMRRALETPNTGMAIMIHSGGPTNADGHPRNKADFGYRLSLLALHDVYGQDIPVWSGPVFRSGEPDGGKMVVTFDHAEGLKALGGEPKGFAIAGADRHFVWANARIDAGKVIVWSDSVKEPAAVRYDWASNPIGNLRNSADIPASPFRTDDWP